VNLEDRIERIERGVAALLSRLEGVPADALYQAPAVGEWPVMSTLAHVAEMLPYWAHQAEGIARVPGQPFGRLHDDPGRLGAIEQHGQDAAEVVRDGLQASLAEAVQTLRELPAAALTLSGQHPRRGSMQVDELIDAFMVEHIEEHVQQIDAALSALR
jgi:uncharacterized damage-inducible protein DinB